MRGPHRKKMMARRARCDLGSLSPRSMARSDLMATRNLIIPQQFTSLMLLWLPCCLPMSRSCVWDPPRF